MSEDKLYYGLKTIENTLNEKYSSLNLSNLIKSASFKETTVSFQLGKTWNFGNVDLIYPIREGNHISQ